MAAVLLVLAPSSALAHSTGAPHLHPSDAAMLASFLAIASGLVWMTRRFRVPR